MLREALRILRGMSLAILAHLAKNQIVSMNILGRICEFLKCDVKDIVNYEEEE